MSINLENPDTALGMVDAAANYNEQISLALAIGDISHARTCVEQVRRLLFNAQTKIEEDEEAK